MVQLHVYSTVLYEYTVQYHYNHSKLMYPNVSHTNTLSYLVVNTVLDIFYNFRLETDLDHFAKFKI